MNFAIQILNSTADSDQYFCEFVQLPEGEVEAIVGNFTETFDFEVWATDDKSEAYKVAIGVEGLGFRTNVVELDFDVREFYADDDDGDDGDDEGYWLSRASDGEFDGDGLASAGWGTDEDYGGGCYDF